MCGIFGTTSSDEQLLTRAVESLHHRGPDAHGIHKSKHVQLGHTRLSIIDLSEDASQPMHSTSGRFTIVFNGEIYNFQEIKQQLPEYSFRTKGDTEVVLAAYEKWGEDCLGKLNGIFAFAILDNEQGNVFLARDRMGIKPLYYYHNGKHFTLSSEIKAIFEDDRVIRQVDITGFNHYMRVGYVPEPRTLFKHIWTLPRASFATFKKGEFIIKQYWTERQTNRRMSFSKAAKAVEVQVDKAVERQLVSDRPVGVYLSGGIDSTILLDSMSKSHSNIKTFSVGFDLEDHEQSEKFNADFTLARRTAKQYGTDHHEVLLHAREVPELLEKVLYHLDQPIANPTSIAMMKIAKQAKKDVAVVLGGDGGDELFGGYERYRLHHAAVLYQKFVPGWIRKKFEQFSSLRKLNTSFGENLYMLFAAQDEKTVEQMISSQVYDKYVTKECFSKFFSDHTGKSKDNAYLLIDRKTWMLNEALVLADKMSMSSGVELRVPLLDNDVVALANTIPFRHKVSLRDKKRVLKAAFAKRLPEYIISQPKRGWFSPGSKWLRNPEVLAYVRKVLDPGYYPPTASLFQWGNIHRMLDEHVEGRAYHYKPIWQMLMFQIWAKRWNVSL